MIVLTVDKVKLEAMLFTSYLPDRLANGARETAQAGKRKEKKDTTYFRHSDITVKSSLRESEPQYRM